MTGLSVVASYATEPQIFSSFDQTIEALLIDVENEYAFDFAIKFISLMPTVKKNRAVEKLKKITGVGVTEIKKIVLGSAPEPLTHIQIADSVSLDCKNKTGSDLVGTQGAFWSYNNNNGLWTSNTIDSVMVNIGRDFIGEKNCKKTNDYKGISNLLYSAQLQESFFDNAANGVATPSEFYCVSGDKIVKRPHSYKNKSQFAVSVEPEKKEPSLFMGVLRDAFGDTFDNQSRTLRMMMGLALFGILPEEQRAGFLYGAGRSGKSLIIKIISQLIPDDYRTAVSPFDLGDEYKRAELAGKRFNFVPEMSKDGFIPDAEFKSVVGGDEILARQPFLPNFKFKNRASCIFNGNFLLATKDTTVSFYDRWMCVNFLHTKPASERDTKLEQKIIDNELGAVLAWCLDGVNDYLENGLYLSPEHYALIEKWKNNTCSVASWINDHGENSVEKNVAAKIRVSTSYKLYKAWAQYAGRKPFGLSAFKDSMVRIGYTSSKYDGYDVYKGIKEIRTSLNNEFK